MTIEQAITILNAHRHRDRTWQVPEDALLREYVSGGSPYKAPFHLLRFEVLAIATAYEAAERSPIECVEVVSEPGAAVYVERIVLKKARPAIPEDLPGHEAILRDALEGRR